MGRGKNAIKEERGFFRESLHLVGQYFKARLLITSDTWRSMLSFYVAGSRS